MESLNTRFQKEVFEPYKELLKTKYKFHSTYDHAKRIWESKLTREELINGPYLEQSKNYEKGDFVDNLPLHEKTKNTIKNRKKLQRLWKHQSDAIRLILDGHNAVIATGTSSGKTLCYQIPILDDLVRHPSPGLRAIIIYPLNALVNDQLEEWELMLSQHPNISFARFTGQTPDNQKDYVDKLKDRFFLELEENQFSQQEKQRKIQQKVQEQLQKDVPNKLNHREAIRSSPPNVLITNFSMLEYLLERPIDVPIFENAQLKFIVLDEAHAYRGVQATEIAFLIRRLKDRLGVEKVNCIATSATLGKPDDPISHQKVREFASDLFGDGFQEPNPIHGTNEEPSLLEPSLKPTPNQYVHAFTELIKDPNTDLRKYLGVNLPYPTELSQILLHDTNLYRMRKEILRKPTLLSEASQLLWLGDKSAEDGLQALLEIIAIAKKDDFLEDMLPTRLHYFIRAQDGLYICLNRSCPGRTNGKAAFFVTRKNTSETPEGECQIVIKPESNQNLSNL